jgi:hypothetical protein
MCSFSKGTICFSKFVIHDVHFSWTFFPKIKMTFLNFWRKWTDVVCLFQIKSSDTLTPIIRLRCSRLLAVSEKKRVMTFLKPIHCFLLFHRYFLYFFLLNYKYCKLKYFFNVFVCESNTRHFFVMRMHDLSLYTLVIVYK